MDDSIFPEHAPNTPQHKKYARFFLYFFIFIVLGGLIYAYYAHRFPFKNKNPYANMTAPEARTVLLDNLTKETPPMTPAEQKANNDQRKAMLKQKSK